MWKRSWRGCLTLALLFALVGLITSRIGLIVHEFIGHGGAAVALGGGVETWKLFAFGGGWISYLLDARPTAMAQLVITMGGVALQSLVALGIYLVARASRDSLRGMLLKLVAFLLTAHACFYLAAGTHYGYGDGRILHNQSMPWRVAVVVVFSALLLAMLWALARLGMRLAVTSGALAELRYKAVSLSLAAAFAGVLHGGLAMGEGAIVRDRVYADNRRHEVVVQAQRHVRDQATQAIAQGAQLSAAQIAKLRQAYLARHRPFPLNALLAVLGALVWIAALRWPMPAVLSDTARRDWLLRSIRKAALVLLALVTVVVAIDLLAP